MSLFGSLLGGGALSGGLNSLFGNANAINQYETRNNWMKAVDPLGASIGNALNSSAKSQAQKQIEYASSLAGIDYQYQKLAALEMPSLVRKGYEDAGYNALLALGQTGGATNAPRVGDGSAYPDRFGARDNRVDPMLVAALRQANANVEKTKAETTRAKFSIAKDSVQTAVTALATLLGARALSKKAIAAATVNAGGHALQKVKGTANTYELPMKSAKSGHMFNAALFASAMKGVAPAAAGLGYAGLQMALGEALKSRNNTPVLRSDHPRLYHEGVKHKPSMSFKPGKMSRVPSWLKPKRHN